MHPTRAWAGRFLAARPVEFSIQGLILLSLATFALETLPDLKPSFRQALGLAELFSVALFTLEYVLRIYAAERRLAFVFSFYGLIDLLAILPFYLTRTVDLRSVRIFRLFRLIRAFKLLRYSAAARRFRLAFRSIKDELMLFLAATLFVLFFASVGIYYFENPAQPDKFSSVFHSLWWAVSTMTTVGYGDIYPVTTGGKIFTFFTLMVSLGVVAVPTGLISSALTRHDLEEEQGPAGPKDGGGPPA